MTLSSLIFHVVDCRDFFGPDGSASLCSILSDNIDDAELVQLCMSFAKYAAKAENNKGDSKLMTCTEVV